MTEKDVVSEAAMNYQKSNPDSMAIPYDDIDVRKAFIAGHQSRDEEVKELKEALKWALDKYEYETTSSTYNGLSVRVRELRKKFNIQE